VDYKVYCFHGVPKYILVCDGRENGRPRFYFFDVKWHFCPITRDGLAAPDGFTLKKPPHLADMLACAADLSAPFPFVRVDFYEADNRLIFGEMTFTPAAGLEAAGTRCYDVPMGGASPIGSAGFVAGWVELREQLEALGIQADVLCHATGTGGTLAGLAAGRALLGDATRILPVAVSPKDAGYEARAAALANDTLALLGAEERVAPGDLGVERGYYAPGYEVPNQTGSDAIRLLARTEGILLDPVYSGKGFGGMLDQIRTGAIPQGSRVVYWHTGGATALFAEAAMVGDVV